MNQEVTNYIQKLPKWQIAVCETLRTMIYNTIPNIQERLQYGKPHYLKNGHYACVVTASKDKVSFMLFNALELEEIKGFFKSATGPERKTATITENQAVNFGQLASLLHQASAKL